MALLRFLLNLIRGGPDDSGWGSSLLRSSLRPQSRSLAVAEWLLVIAVAVGLGIAAKTLHTNGYVFFAVVAVPFVLFGALWRVTRGSRPFDDEPPQGTEER